MVANDTMNTAVSLFSIYAALTIPLFSYHIFIYIYTFIFIYIHTLPHTLANLLSILSNSPKTKAG